MAIIRELKFSEHRGDHKKALIKCDSQISEKCRKEYQKETRLLLSQRQNTNGRDVCLFCSRKENYTGRKNSICNHETLDDEMMGEIDTEGKAYLLGWIASDGRISKKGTITISIKKDDYPILEELHKIAYGESAEPNIRISNGFATFYINSKTMCSDICNLLEMSPEAKPCYARFPKLENDDLKWVFLRGYFDGNGSINNIKTKGSPECKITSSSKAMLDDMVEFCNIPCNRASDSLYWNGVNCLDFLGKLYEKCEYRLSRKHDQYLDWSVWVPTLEKGDSKRTPHFWCNRALPEAVLPSKKRISDSGYDLTLVKKDKTFGNLVEMYDTGIRICVSHGYYMDLIPRSSIIKSGYILANSVGVIDRSYRGTIKVPLIKIDKDAPDLELPCRLVQLIPRPIVHMQVEEVEDLNLTEREDGGFGSTG